MESINKNTEVVGVSDALKQLAMKKSSSASDSLSLQPSSLKLPTNEDGGVISDHKITINPSSSTDDGAEVTNQKDDEVTQTCGWWKIRPKCLQRFMNPKYALVFLCLCGAIQG